MPKSYFVRHTDGLAVRRDDLEKLWNENRIAVHFPGDTSMNERDSESLRPEDYEKPDEKGAIRAFAELAEIGGYVWAQSYVSNMVKAGYVRGRREGGDGVSMERGARWDLRGRTHPGREDGHPATLKTLRMEKVVELGKDDGMNLRAARPPGVVACRWNVVGSRLACVVERKPPQIEWSVLSTPEQETACAEFLRERHDRRPDLPVLARLLLPVGRTLEDVDAYGLTDTGTYLYVQVTHHKMDVKAAEKKAARLHAYSGHTSGGASLVFFGKGSVPPTTDNLHNIFFVSVDYEVLPWICSDEDYCTALFSS